ncbi:unnamed protein product [Pylaiella littoralis]
MEYQQQDPRFVKGGWSYAKFVRDNPTAAHTLARLLQYSGFFAPARFADRDLSIESGYALSSLANLAHARILLEGQGGPGQGAVGVEETYVGSANDGQFPGSRTQLESKRREKLSSKAVLAERMRVALAVIAHVQVVVEKLAGQHGGPRRRRQAITYLETLKALSRLLLLACTREMVIGGGAYVPWAKPRSPPPRNRNKPGGPGGDGGRLWREVDLGGVGSHDPQPSASRAAGADLSPSLSRHPPEVYTGKRSGVKLIVPPRASVTWSGRGRSNRPIGSVGRAFNASSSSYSIDGSSSSSCPQRRCVVDEVFTCTSCQERSSDSDCRGFVHGNGGGRDASAGGPSEPANGCCGLSCVGGEWRSQRRACECVGSGGLARPGDGGELSQVWLMAGEAIHILRPLVYSYSYGLAGEGSWRQWLTSLGMDAAAYTCTARAGGGGARSLLTSLGATSGRAGAGDGVLVLPYLDDEQAAELSRRKMLWFLYLMRSPAFELLAEPVSRGAAGVFEGVPLLGGMADYALNMLLYVQRHHFYTSAS